MTLIICKRSKNVMLNEVYVRFSVFHMEIFTHAHTQILLEISLTYKHIVHMKHIVHTKSYPNTFFFP